MKPDVWLDGVKISSRYNVSGIKHSTIFRREGWSGDYQSSCSFAAPPDFDATWFSEGVTYDLADGGCLLWSGKVAELTPGETWTISAFGHGADAENFDALTGGVGTYVPSSNPNGVIDAAITRGLGWDRVDSFGSTDLAVDAGEALSVSKICDRAAQRLGKRWWVDSYARATLVSEPTTPTFWVSPGDAYLGTLDDEYVTHLRGIYVSSVDADGMPDGWATVETSDAHAATKFGGVRERLVDLRALGVMLPATAQNDIDGRFELVGARTGWTNRVTLTRGNVRTYGAWCEPNMVRAGTMLRIPGVMDSRSQPTTKGSIDVVLAEVEHDEDAGTSIAAPLGFVPRDQAGALAAAQPKREEVEVA